MLYNIPTGQVDVRPFLPEDSECVTNIELKSYDLQWDKQTWGFMAPDCFVAVMDDRIVGFCVSQTNGNIIHILKMAVTPAYRRRKVGTALMFDVCLRQTEMKFVSVTIGISQKDAIEFVKTHDFKLQGEFDEFPAWPEAEKGFFYIGKILREQN